MFIFSRAIISVTLLLPYCPAKLSNSLFYSYAVLRQISDNDDYSE